MRVWLNFERNLVASEKRVRLQCDIVIRGEQVGLSRNEPYLEAASVSPKKKRDYREKVFTKRYIFQVVMDLKKVQKQGMRR